MSSPRQLSPWYWVMFGLALLACALWVSDLVLNWAPKWMTLALLIVPFAVCAFIWKMGRIQFEGQESDRDRQSTPEMHTATENKSAWTAERIRATYCLILLPILTATATAAVILAVLNDVLIAVALGAGTLAGIVALAYLLYNAPRVAARDAETRALRGEGRDAAGKRVG